MYAQTGMLRCFRCGKIGHLINRCPGVHVPDAQAPAGRTWSSVVSTGSAGPSAAPQAAGGTDDQQVDALDGNITVTPEATATVRAVNGGSDIEVVDVGPEGGALRPQHSRAYCA